MAISTATVKAPRRLPRNTRPQVRSIGPRETPGFRAIHAIGTSVNTPVSRSKPIRYSRMKPTGNSRAPSRGSPVWVETVTEKAAPRVRIAPAIEARSTVTPAG